MKKTVGKIFKYTLLAGICIVFFITVTFFILYFSASTKFDAEKITNSNLAVSLYDSQKRPLQNIYLHGEYVELECIPEITKSCFLSIEDKNFYTHNGLNFKRMISATLTNIKNFGFVEGASTISQQLIKNTHLTNEKTLKRKINEIKLTLAMEKVLTKDEIFEAYLNIIYFGDNCYGIQNASKHYFSKPASKLNLGESAMLAGIIKSPNKYHPVKNYQTCLNRRNLVLNELYEDKKISYDEYINVKNENTPLNINLQNKRSNAYEKSAIKEAEQILKMPEKQIAIGGYRIYTYSNREKQSALENSIDNQMQENCAMISIGAKTGQIEAYAEKSNISLINVKRQPASAIKPVLVYAPAINENIISPSTQILDENISINGYEPKNIGEKEHGFVDATYALAQSLNIPAVKILSYVGIQKAKRYVEAQDIEFDKSDNSLALALGGMTYGTTLKQLTNCYQTLANNGKFISAKFIEYIVDSNGKVIYKNSQNEKRIFRDDTAYLTTHMLHSSTTSGTSKRLSDLDFYVASKTGTSSISKQNIDAYNLSYTSEDVVGCWIGNLDNSATNIVGGGKPTAFVKSYLKSIYSENTPANFAMPSSIIEIDIDLKSLQNEHIVCKANNFLPERYRQKAIFSRFNQPKSNDMAQLTIMSPKLSAKANNGVAEITFNAEYYCTYDLYVIIDGQEKYLQSLTNNNGYGKFICDMEPKKINSFYVIAKAKDYSSGEIYQSTKSNTVELLCN